MGGTKLWRIAVRCRHCHQRAGPHPYAMVGQSGNDPADGPKLMPRKCTNALWNHNEFGGAYLTCSPPTSDRVGPKNVSIEVARQRTFVSSIENPAFMAICKKGWYGQEGEYCAPCPHGSACPGGDVEPTALRGFWKLELLVKPDLRKDEYNPLCDKRRRERVHCPFIIPCDPPDSCEGNNVCSDKYNGTRCALCMQGYYRVLGECIECPPSPALVAGAFLLMCIMLGILMNKLQKNRIHMALLDIGVNYFQVLATFMRTKVEWPEEVKFIVRAFSFFNLNLELLAPECSFESFSFWRRWRWSMALPFIIVPGLSMAQNIRLRSKSKTERMSVVVGSAVTSLYFIYLPVTRVTFDMINCSPTDPPDGYEYLSAVFEKCHEPDVCQDREGNPVDCHFEHVKYADWGVVLYVIGIPLSFAYVLKTYHNKQSSTGDASHDYLLTAFKKLYFLFDSEHYYWILVIMSRKVMISFASLMFRRSPTFQLAF